MSFAKIITYIYNNKLFKDIKTAYKLQFKSVEEIKFFQEQKFKKLIEHAQVNVPYYKDKLVGVNTIDDITKINFLTKEKIKIFSNDLKAKNLNEQRFLRNSTSGSTGESLYFYSDAENFYLKAVNIRGDKWAGLEYGAKSLYFWGAERDIEQNRGFYKFLKDKYIIQNKIISAYHMSDVDLLDFIKEYNNYKPSILVSYPTPLYHLACFIEKNDIEIWEPKGIVTSAETLFPFQRKKIEEIFKCKIFNRYGCREVGHIASECEKHDGLHINVDRFVVEIVDSNGNLCKFGESGEIIITDLDNYTFPMIRYRIGDLGILTDRTCSCGRNLPLFKKIEGRVFDLIVGVNGNTVAGTFWTLLKNKINGWEKFQIIQEETDEIEIIVERNNKIEPDFNENITQIVKDKLGENMKILVKIVENIPQTKAGKHRWVISKLK